jgi:hypothetical protein
LRRHLASDVTCGSSRRAIACQNTACSHTATALDTKPAHCTLHTWWVSSDEPYLPLPPPQRCRTWRPGARIHVRTPPPCRARPDSLPLPDAPAWRACTQPRCAAAPRARRRGAAACSVPPVPLARCRRRPRCGSAGAPAAAVACSVSKRAHRPRPPCIPAAPAPAHNYGCQLSKTQVNLSQSTISVAILMFRRWYG